MTITFSKSSDDQSGYARIFREFLRHPETWVLDDYDHNLAPEHREFKRFLLWGAQKLAKMVEAGEMTPVEAGAEINRLWCQRRRDGQLH